MINVELSEEVRDCLLDHQTSKKKELKVKQYSFTLCIQDIVLEHKALTLENELLRQKLADLHRPPQY